MGLIYMRISPSGGKYIGQTIFSEEERWKAHCNSAYSPTSTDYNNIISKAIRKYGEKNFTVKILENNIPNNKLNEREIYWIDFYKTYFEDNQNGYNMTRGGNGRLKFTDEILLNLWNQGLSLGEIGKIINGTPNLIGKRLQALGIDPLLFMKRGNEYSAFQSIKNNPINQEIFNLWNKGFSLTEIRSQLGIDIHTAANMLKNFYKISNEEIQKRKNQAISKSKSKAILQFDLNNNFIKEWSSAYEASKELKIDNSSIRKCVLKKLQTAGGYKWKEKV